MLEHMIDQHLISYNRYQAARDELLFTTRTIVQRLVLAHFPHATHITVTSNWEVDHGTYYLVASLDGVTHNQEQLDDDTLVNRFEWVEKSLESYLSLLVELYTDNEAGSVLIPLDPTP